MSKHSLKAPDSEKERQQLLDELRANSGANWGAQYEPGSFGCHELLRTALAAELVDRYVSHPACVQNRDWFNLAEPAVVALHQLYQRIGAAHLSID